MNNTKHATNPVTPDKGKKEQMRSMFNRIAPSYDMLNHLFSCHIDRWWRHRATRLAASRQPRRILDLATGTGDMAIALAQRIPQCEILGLDLSEEMLSVAQRKVKAHNLEQRIILRTGDAEHLPMSDKLFDAVTVGFGIRNFARLEQCFQEMHRVLQPNGRLIIVELTTPKNRLIRTIYEFYSFRLMPLIGGWISREKKAYRYLPASVHAFHSPERVVEMMQGAGFRDCAAHPLTFGIAHLFTATR